MEEIIQSSSSNLDLKERSYATGKRKNSIARVWLKKGEGKITINGKSLSKYFARPVLQMVVNQPLNIIDGENTYDIKATVKGGGLSGQAGALRHGISKALSLYDINDSFFEKVPDWKGEKFVNNEIIKEENILREKLQKTMSENVGIFKFNKGLDQAEKEILNIYRQITLIYNQNKLTQNLSELRNMISISYLLIKQAQQIKVNKGVFYNFDNEK